MAETPHGTQTTALHASRANKLSHAAKRRPEHDANNASDENEPTAAAEQSAPMTLRLFLPRAAATCPSSLPRDWPRRRIVPLATPCQRDTIPRLCVTPTRPPTKSRPAARHVGRQSWPRSGRTWASGSLPHGLNTAAARWPSVGSRTVAGQSAARRIATWVQKTCFRRYNGRGGKGRTARALRGRANRSFPGGRYRG